MKVRKIIESNTNKIDKLDDISKLLKENVSYYNWVGFYIVNAQMPTELLLISYCGEPTEHLRIPFGKGVCGQAALLRETLLVQDVKKESNYLSCSERVKSEIVIPIMRNSEMLGQLDIDSHTISAFTLNDEIFLKGIAEMVREIL